MHPVGSKQHYGESRAIPESSHIERRSFQKPPLTKRRYSLDHTSPRKCRLSVETDGEPTIEDISNQDSGYDGDVEVVWPYQYEDAEADAPSQQPLNAKWIGPKRLQYDDVSHSGLIDWMGSLRCDSDQEVHGTKGGRKRKSRPSLESVHQKKSLRSSVQQFDAAGRGQSIFMPKKPKRESHRGSSMIFDADKTKGSTEGPFVSGTSAGMTTEAQESSATTNDSMDLD
ncbi:hypothetical protein PRK78_005390 [Emydomyces testavorans]|uniref:Uncharacterized protein n=1 Tax=Emydomyces testavorans TaxID=2070801 RepID=A0AAF0IK00_9EURO|nr:hypothetical protein PRK78_005390 [Emydomyces testavorans]